MNTTTLLTVLGVSTTALVALLSLFINNRAALRAQRDTQFYEALKRFGDKESVTVRLSAAVLIGEIADSRRGSYLNTAIDQLVGGLQLEKNLIVLTSITNTLGRLAERNPNTVITKVYEVNLALEEEMILNLAKYLQALRKQSNEGDLRTDAIAVSFWREAIVVTRFPEDQLALWRAAHRRTFYRTLLSAAHRLGDANEVETREYLTAAEEILEISAERIRLNDSLFANIYLGMFQGDEDRLLHRKQMDILLEYFLSQRALRRGVKEIPTHWYDLLHGRPTARKAHPYKAIH